MIQLTLLYTYVYSVFIVHMSAWPILYDPINAPVYISAESRSGLLLLPGHVMQKLLNCS